MFNIARVHFLSISAVAALAVWGAVRSAPAAETGVWGFVKMEYDQPLAGVTVDLKIDGEPIATTRTDRQGYYSFEDVPNGSVVLTFSANEEWMVTVIQAGEYKYPRSRRVDSLFQSLPPEHGEYFGREPLRFLAIELTEVDSAKPLARVPVHLGKLGRWTTDGLGRLAIENLPRGRISLEIQVSGYELFRQEIEIDYTDKILQIKLKRLGSENR